MLDIVFLNFGNLYISLVSSSELCFIPSPLN